jgi:crotonobetainyl-CoA:carnitine CoA-transferase CaiB-like acyl-CoA transferase
MGKGESMAAASSDTANLGRRLPLAGITVIDFGQIFQGPYATLLLAKGGADVIKTSRRPASRCAAAPRPARARRCRLRCSTRTSAR